MMAAMQQPQLRGEIRNHEPLAGYTTWRVGGEARELYRPADLDDLALFLSQLSDTEEIHFIGLGSNLLVRDGGVDGTVILTHGLLGQIEQMDENRIYVEAGVTSAKLSRFAARAGLAGAQFLSGIPGTVGGALTMNAGCFGSEIWPLVESVQTINRHGVMITRNAAEYEVGYRSVKWPQDAQDEWFVAATLKLEKGEPEALLAENRSLLEKRGASQPTQLPNAGSVFRNPENNFAARLIESCDLKGHCIGKACVSEKHANFIINSGGATATEIEQLMEYVAAQVEQTHGVKLEREVRVIGQPVSGDAL
ncbi:MAG: UDP-N-acetylmuramate dehydrogenase [Gammaproteobacteria bacterium]|nr:UDP-N-acetylmuramate dehydrogenase [Gammaproteobacteria bacterium]